MLAANPDPGVRLRPPEQIALALERGQSYVVRHGAEACACSLLYKFDCRSDDGRIYSEIGTQLVLAEGYGLQSLLAKLHVVQVHVEEEGADLNAIFAVVAAGTPSEHNLRHHVGLAEWKVPEALAMERGRAGLKFDPVKRTLAASPEVLGRAAADLSDWRLADGRIRAPKGGVEIYCDLPWLVTDALTVGR